MSRGRKKVAVTREEPYTTSFGFETELEESPMKKSSQKSISEIDLHKLYRMEDSDAEAITLSSTEPTPRKRGSSK